MRASATDAAHADNWHGGFYELSMKLGDHDDARLDAALRSLWLAAPLGEPFRRRERAPQSRVPRVSADCLLAGPLDSLATIPGLGTTLCTVLVVREETDEAGVTRYGDDWLDLCLPLGALSSLDDRVGAYPFGDTTDSRAWREPIERWFEEMARVVFDVVPFAHAVTGFEVSGIELSDAKSGWVGLFHPTDHGDLTLVPVSIW